MSRLNPIAVGRAGLALALLALAPSPALAGPPWISVEYPANPHDRETRGALVLLRTYHHGDQTRQPVSGTAEGIVGGKRRSIPLQLTGTSGAGAWAVRGELPKEGSWVLVLNLVEPNRTVSATALVGLDRRGEVAGVKVPSRVQDGWTIPRAATAREVDEMLSAAVASAAPGKPVAGSSLLAGAGLLLLIPAGVVARRRTRRSAGA